MVLLSLMNRCRSVIQCLCLVCSIVAATSSSTQLHAQTFLINPTSVGQFQVSNWKSYTSMVIARAACQDSSGRLWVASSGGIFSVNLKTNDYQSYRNTEGMVSLNCTSIAYNMPSNSIYIGSFDGAMQILQLDSMRWTYISDIQSASGQYPRRAINNIQFRGDTALLSADFGLSLFDIKRMVFIETVDRVGKLEEKTPVHTTYLTSDSLLIATDAGVMIAPIRTATLRLPEIWRRIPVAGVDTMTNCQQLVRHPNGMIYVMSPTAIYRLENDSLRHVISRVQSYLPFKALAAYDTTLYFCTSERIADINLNTLAITHPSALNGLTMVNTSGAAMLLALYQSSGVGIVHDTTLRLYAPNSMYSNRAQRMVVDKNSRLWVATSNLSIDGQGYSQFDGDRWYNYNTTLFPKFYSNDVWRISLTNDSVVWGGTWGNGALRMQMLNDSIFTQHYTNKNSSLVGLNAGDFVLTGDASSDINGNSWLLNYDPTGGDGPGIHKISKDGIWTPYRNDVSASQNYFILAIDGSSTKWMGGPQGLLWFNENNSVSKWGTVTIGNSSLPDNNITALAVDHNGALWIGTATGGIGVMSFPSGVTRTTPTVPGITRLRLLRDQVINDIMVDAQNNKWIATSTGVWVMTGDGTDTIGYISRKAYPKLLSDNVRCLASNPEDGTVYIGGTEGINAIQTLALRPLDAFQLDMYPQPFSPTRDKQLVIDGLSFESIVHITTLDGILIRSIETTSRRAVWDGRDSNGNMVSSGVYLLLTVAQGNATSTAGKILVSP